MKKQLHLILLIAMVYSNIQSQIIFKEDFKNGMPNTFKIVDKDNLKPHSSVASINAAWVVTANSVEEGDSVATSTSYYDPSGRSSDWLITPAIELNNFALLSWEAVAVDPDFPDGYVVLLSTTGNELTDFTDTLFSTTKEQSDWTLRQVDLSKYINQTIYIAFVNNSNDMFLLLLDDIIVFEKPAYDASIINISNLSYGNCGLTNNEVISIKVANFGYDTIKEFEATYIVNGNITNTELANMYINPDDTIEYTFSNTVDLSSIGYFQVSAYINMTADANQDNDTLKAVTFSNYWDLSTASYNMDFENEKSLEMTLLEQGDFNNDQMSWLLYKDAYYSHTGSYFIGYNYNTPKNTNDYLFSRCFYLKSTKIYELSLWYSSISFSKASILKNLSVILGSSKDSANIMTDTLYQVNNIGNMEEYINIKLRFTVPQDSIYYLGFYTSYDSSSLDNEYLFIDDIMLKEVQANDIGIVSHNNIQGGCMLTDTNYISVTLQNEGFDTIQSFVINATVNNIVFSSDTVNTEILPSETLTYQLIHPADLSANGIQYIKVWTNLANDIIKDNDSLLFTIFNSNNDIINSDYINSFDNPLENSSWTILDKNNDNTTWIIDNNEGLLKCVTSETNKSDDWAFSPCMFLEAGKHYEVSFDCKSGFYSFWGLSIPYISSLNLYIGNEPSVLGMIDTALFSINNYTHLSYLKATKVFYVETSGIYYLGLHGVSNADNGEQYIDNFKVNVLTSADIVLVDIESPYSDCGLGNSQNVSINVFNRANDTLKGFTAYYSINGLLQVDTVKATIPPMTYYSHSFSQKANMGNTSIAYNFDFWVKCEKDNDAYNDSITNHIVYNLTHDLSSGHYIMGFEEDEILDGWQVFNLNNDNYRWSLNTNKIHSGTYSAKITSNPDLITNDWLVSRCLYMKSNKTYNISFWYAALDSLKDENLLIYCGTTQEPTKMTKIGDIVKFKNKHFNYYGVTFVPKVSKYYYIGLKANSMAGKAGFIIDDIRIKEVICETKEITPQIIGSNTINEGDTISLIVDGSYDKYVWSNKSYDTIMKVTTPGEYSVTVTDSCGNTAIAKTGVYYTGINEYQNISAFVNVFPTPSQDFINIVSNNYRLQKIEIVNMLGSIEKEVYNPKTSTVIDIQNLSNGIYFVNIFTTNNEKITKKIIVQKL